MGKLLMLALVAALAWTAWSWNGGPPPPLVWDAPMVASLSADLVDERGATAPPRAFGSAPLTLLYFSAKWCPHCRDFDPVLADYYREHRGGTAFRVLFVSADEGEPEMRSHMYAADMPGWGVRYGSANAMRIRKAYAGAGIPCLVLVDRDGRVIADSYDHGRYVGPRSVLDKLGTVLAAGG
jgi:thiol-disulfide isomerase/thioredoxin